MFTKYFLSLTTCFALFITIAEAQIQMPQASPPSKTTQLVGLTQISLEYSRPSVRDRKIFGTLVPYGEVWRTGANSATTFEFSTDVSIEGRSLPAGKYALYSIPGSSTWTLIFYRNTSLWGAIGYDPKDDVFRIQVPRRKLKSSVETFEIGFNNITDTGTTIRLQWEKSEVSFRIETEVDAIVMKQIEDQVINKTPSNPGVYFQAATYYFNTGKDLSKALEWVTKSVEADPKYWTIHLKAKIEQKLGLNDAAIKSAQTSMEMARKENNPDYIRLNEQLIKSIK
ncbi:hypothetical protein ADIS_2788 [Lunatimonas lonarensis]|uniref:Dihydrolipoamide dehydrogenase n=1 Tax=Lunatimonas lonarensis TaxID=1232681 RepID=R7ZRV9_9BACT|nr:DUF2911 domain-containing protein [Lunatimonas lonarensis]EON76729.1 hypothetical protein ADIS_2788 [Lunatimonas lonarensis]